MGPQRVLLHEQGSPRFRNKVSSATLPVALQREPHCMPSPEQSCRILNSEHGASQSQVIRKDSQKRDEPKSPQRFLLHQQGSPRFRNRVSSATLPVALQRDSQEFKEPKQLQQVSRLPLHRLSNVGAPAGLQMGCMQLDEALQSQYTPQLGQAPLSHRVSSHSLPAPGVNAASSFLARSWSNFRRHLRKGSGNQVAPPTYSTARLLAAGMRPALGHSC